MEEVIDVDLLPSWIKFGEKIKVVGGRHNGNWGIVQNVSHRTLYMDDEYRVKCHMPGVGDDVFFIKNLRKYS